MLNISVLKNRIHSIIFQLECHEKIANMASVCVEIVFAVLIPIYVSIEYLRIWYRIDETGAV